MLFRSIEITSTANLGKHLELLINGEWLINSQVKKDGHESYPLPFSPPANLFAELTYKVNPDGDNESTRFSVHCKSVLKQTRIARNEDVTPGYSIVGLGFHTKIKTGPSKILIDIQAHNIFNQKYFNHISFYRKLEIPEPGRNIQVLLSFPF